ncbi:MAG: hypothetical protein FJ197_05865 [Gammaproteobacteria bacterium]|nr:hypothetical protein [Gammaproteobacteria bacterium]
MEADNTGGRNIAVVTVGAVAGQLILIAAMPVLTRLYSPDEIGQYSALVAVLGLLTTIVCLHYELAIPLPKSDRIARRAAWVAMFAALALSGVVLMVLWLVAAPAVATLVGLGVEAVLWMIPACLVINGIGNVLMAWAIRVRAYNGLAASRAALGAGQAIPQLAAGFLGFGVSGLAVSQILGPAAAAAALAPAASSGSSGRWSLERDWRRLYAVARRYRKFPLITTWSSLINAIGAQLPVLALAPLFGPFVTGQFALAYRLLQVPLRLVGQSMSQVYLGSIAAGRANNDMTERTWQLLRFLAALGIPSFGVLGVVAPELFVVVFGDEWEQAGEFGRLLVPWLLMSFVATVMSPLVSVLQQQGRELGYQLLYAVTAIGALLLGAVADSPMVAVTLLGAIGALAIAAKVIWLARSVAIPVGRVLRLFAGEIARFAPLAIGLVALSQGVQSELLLLAAAAFGFAVIHWWNFRFRRIYTLNHVVRS